SRPRTRSVEPSTATSSQVVTAIRLGRILARWAKIPTSGHAGLPRGTREPVCTASGCTRSKRNTTSTWLNASSPRNDASPYGADNVIVASIAPQSSSIASSRGDDTTPIARTTNSVVVASMVLQTPAVAADGVSRLGSHEHPGGEGGTIPHRASRCDTAADA